MILEIGKNRYTPPIDAGLLAGIWRENELAAGRLFERVITIDDLRSADRVFICNSVRGEIEIGAIEGLGGEVIWQSAEIR